MQPNRRGRPTLLESQRREINEALAYGTGQPDYEAPPPRDTGAAFGPPWGFAQVGSKWGQNRPGFFGR
jgi:hypothetical protein